MVHLPQRCAAMKEATMPIPTSQLKTWGNVQWQTKMKHVAPSKGGAVGVMFVWCANPGSGGPDYANPGSADFVVKPSMGSAATTKFAEKLLDKAIGAQGVNTLPVLRSDPRFAAILAGLQRFKVAADNTLHHMGANATPPQRDLAARWASVWPSYQNASALMVQDLALGMAEFDEVQHDPLQGGLAQLLSNRALMVNLGRLFAADAILGNGDRLCSLNTTNILFKKTTAQILSVDSQAILVSYDALLQQGGVTARQWVDQIVTRNAGAQVAESPQQQVLAASFALQDLYDVDRWWTVMFRGQLERSTQRHNEQPPGEAVWNWARGNFMQGVDEGLRAVDRQLSGINWLMLKSKFKSYEKRYGASPNLDWTNLKIRRMYIKTVLADRNKPGTPEQKQQLAFDKVVAYAKRKTGAHVV
jgi:hypothetical protein